MPLSTPLLISSSFFFWPFWVHQFFTFTVVWWNTFGDVPWGAPSGGAGDGYVPQIEENRRTVSATGETSKVRAGRAESWISFTWVRGGLSREGWRGDGQRGIGGRNTCNEKNMDSCLQDKLISCVQEEQPPKGIRLTQRKRDEKTGKEGEIYCRDGCRCLSAEEIWKLYIWLYILADKTHLAKSK